MHRDPFTRFLRLDYFEHGMRLELGPTLLSVTRAADSRLDSLTERARHGSVRGAQLAEWLAREDTVLAPGRLEVLTRLFPLVVSDNWGREYTQERRWTRERYHNLLHNCQHFCEELLQWWNEKAAKSE